MNPPTKKTLIRLAILIAIAVPVAASFFDIPPPTVNATAAPVPEPTRTRRRAGRRTVPRPARYSEFPHSAKAHQVVCSTCHKFPSPNWKNVRPEKDAFADITDYPRHESCVGCHKQQFFRGTPPKVCSICHTSPGPRNSSRHPFPNPREIYDQSPKGRNAESDFVVGFPHDKHVDIVTGANQSGDPIFMNASFTRSERRTAAEESCAVCHQTMAPQGKSEDEFLTRPPAKLGDAFWLKKGTFKSAPIGHTVCFTCHNADAGMSPDQQSCGTCHHLKPVQPPNDFDPKLAAAIPVNDKVMLDAWRTRHSAGKFQHEFAAHVDLECATCHTIATMNTADPSTLKVPLSACATCHATATTDDGGAINYEMDQRTANPAFDCVKCHITFGKQAIPESHIKVLKEATGK